MGEFSFWGCRFRHRWGYFKEVTNGHWKGYISRTCRVCAQVQRRKPRILNSTSGDTK